MGGIRRRVYAEASPLRGSQIKDLLSDSGLRPSLARKFPLKTCSAKIAGCAVNPPRLRPPFVSNPLANLRFALRFGSLTLACSRKGGKESPNGKIRLADVLTAKNYLSSEEITTMNSLVNQFLEYAEQQARSRKVMTMHDWEVKLEAILRLNDMSILTSAGKVSMERAKSKASREFEVFEARELERETAQDEDELEDVLKKLVYIPKSDSSKDSECNENR